MNTHNPFLLPIGIARRMIYRGHARCRDLTGRFYARFGWVTDWQERWAARRRDKELRRLERRKDLEHKRRMAKLEQQEKRLRDSLVQVRLRELNRKDRLYKEEQARESLEGLKKLKLQAALDGIHVVRLDRREANRDF